MASLISNPRTACYSVSDNPKRPAPYIVPGKSSLLHLQIFLVDVYLVGGINCQEGWIQLLRITSNFCYHLFPTPSISIPNSSSVLPEESNSPVIYECEVHLLLLDSGLPLSSCYWWMSLCRLFLCLASWSWSSLGFWVVCLSNCSTNQIFWWMPFLW